MAVLPNVAVDVGGGDLEVAAVGHEFHVAAALLRREVDAESQLEGGEQLHAGLLKKGLFCGFSDTVDNRNRLMRLFVHKRNLLILKISGYIGTLSAIRSFPRFCKFFSGQQGSCITAVELSENI